MRQLSFKTLCWALNIDMLALEQINYLAKLTFNHLKLNMILILPYHRDFNMYLYTTAAAVAKSLQLCPTLCDPVDGSPSGSPIPGILQAGTLEWVAISFSKAWKWKVKVKSLSRVQLLATPWTAAHQTLPPLGFSRQEHWGGLPLPSLTPYYSLQYIFIHEWEITNSFPYLSVLIFSIVFNGSQNFVMGVYSTIY